MSETSDIRKLLRNLTEQPHVDYSDEEIVTHFGDLSPAAVLIALTEGPEGLEVILTKRAQTLREHSGEIAFPGGRQDPGDPDLIHTALRESHEEIALVPSDVSVFGALMRMPTITGYNVTTYVGEFTQPYELQANPGEIETLIQAPLHALSSPDIHRVEDTEWNNRVYPLHFFDYDEHLVWGATGLMLYTLIDYLGLRK